MLGDTVNKRVVRILLECNLVKIGQPKSDGKTGSAVYPHIHLFSGEMNLSLLVFFCTGALVAIVNAKVRGLNEVHSCATFYNKKYNEIRCWPSISTTRSMNSMSIWSVDFIGAIILTDQQSSAYFFENYTCSSPKRATIFSANETFFSLESQRLRDPACVYFILSVANASSTMQRGSVPG